MNSGLSRLGIALLAAMFAPALLAADLWGGDCFDTCQKRDG